MCPFPLEFDTRVSFSSPVRKDCMNPRFESPHRCSAVLCSAVCKWGGSGSLKHVLSWDRRVVRHLPRWDLYASFFWKLGLEPSSFLESYPGFESVMTCVCTDQSRGPWGLGIRMRRWTDMRSPSGVAILVSDQWRVPLKFCRCPYDSAQIAYRSVRLVLALLALSLSLSLSRPTTTTSPWPFVDPLPSKPTNTCPSLAFQASHTNTQQGTGSLQCHALYEPFHAGSPSAVLLHAVTIKSSL